MNIFYLDKQPHISAIYHCDQHVVKMILEYAQLLSTTWRWFAEHQPVCPYGTEKELKWTLRPDCKKILELCYKSTHVDHPSAVWVRQSRYHYQYLVRLYDALCLEYRNRYDKVHETEGRFDSPFDVEFKWGYFSNSIWNVSPPPPIHRYSGHKGKFEEPPQCMPDEYKHEDTVTAYRNFYKYDKSKFARYRRSIRPTWLHDIATEYTEDSFQYQDAPRDIYTHFHREYRYMRGNPCLVVE